jgi:hypothetical protein
VFGLGAAAPRVNETMKSNRRVVSGSKPLTDSSEKVIFLGPKVWKELRILARLAKPGKNYLRNVKQKAA